MPVSAEPVSVSAASAIVYEPASGTVLFQKNADEPRAIASTTKLMTALIADETVDPDGIVTVPDAACGIEGTSLGLHAGDHLTMRDLLTGMLLASGNDAANAVALTVCDTLPQFADLMNIRATELHMTHSHFVTPSGLDAEGHQSTARDMALLAAAVLKRDALADICAKKSAVISVGDPMKPRTVTNHNRLLSLYDGAIGLKTGFTQKAGRCLVSAAERDGITLIAVTLGAPDDWNDHKKMLDYGFSRVGWYDPVIPRLSPLPVTGGETPAVTVSAETPPAVPMPNDRVGEVRITTELPRFVFAPVTAGKTAGWVIWSLDGRELCRSRITADQSVAAHRDSPFAKRFFRKAAALIKILIQ